MSILLSSAICISVFETLHPGETTTTSEVTFYAKNGKIPQRYPGATVNKLAAVVFFLAILMLGFTSLFAKWVPGAPSPKRLV